MMKILVSIVIPTYRDWARLTRCLDALQSQSFPKENFEILVVNNDSEGGVPQNFSIPYNCKILHESKPGSYAARNTALKIAEGQIIGFTDSDCIPDQDWIKNAVICLETDHSIDRLAGPVKIFTRQSKPNTVEYYDLIYGFPQRSYVQEGVAVTANFFTYRRNFTTVGFFNSNTMSGGDFEWGKRAQQAGLNIKYSEKVVVNHPARHSLSSLFEKAKRVGKGQVVLMKKSENILEVFKEIFSILRPKTWEVKRIFQKGEKMVLIDKIFLIVLRHLVLWTTDFWRIITRRKSGQLLVPEKEHNRLLE